MGWLILVGVLGLIGYALYVWSGNSDSVDDREDGGWSFSERRSGPFYWRKRWMGMDKLEEKVKESIRKGIEDADAGRLIPYEEIKARLDTLEQLYTEKIDSIQFAEWEDATLNDGLVDNIIEGEFKEPDNPFEYRLKHSMMRTEEIQLLNKILQDIDKRLKARD